MESMGEESRVSDGVTILVPTYNRPNELNRLLHFLKILNNPYHVVVLDGSSRDIVIKNKKIVANFENVTHPDLPENLHLGIRLSIGLNEYVRTKHVVFCPEDDFIIPQGIAKCSAYLDLHPECSAINGQVKCLAHPKKYSQFGFFAFIDHLKFPLVLDQETFLARLLNLNAVSGVGCPPLFYAVRRTEQARKIFSKITSTFKFTSQELLSNALTLLWGKSITVEHLLMIRNYSSDTTRDAIREDPLYGYTPEDAEYIRNILSQELQSTNELSDEIIKYTLDQFIKLPLEKVSDKYAMRETSTPLAKSLYYKKNWLFYFVNYLFPSFSGKLDHALNKDIVVALRKAFQIRYEQLG
jgi:glycosyltransferase domain-containing protein